jgi:hypothetical protein
MCDQKMTGERMKTSEFIIQKMMKSYLRVALILTAFERAGYFKPSRWVSIPSSWKTGLYYAMLQPPLGNPRMASRSRRGTQASWSANRSMPLISFEPPFRYQLKLEDRL